jgi:AbrB family looped-hinge helix DNA binding protein
MEITKISTKGQVVIPEKIRKGIDVGTAFVVTRTDNMIILKKVEGLTKDEKKELKELDKIWRDIDQGKGTS